MAAGLPSVKFKNGLAVLSAYFLRDEETYNLLFFSFQWQPMSENDLLEGLTEGFSCSTSPPAPLPTSTVQKVSILDF